MPDDLSLPFELLPDEVLTPADHAFLDTKAEQIRAVDTNAVIEIGRHLIEAKARVSEGQFLSWLAREFPQWKSRVTAWNYMNVAEQFGDVQHVEHLEITQAALYVLAGPSVPEVAREDAIEQAQAGEHITKAKAEELIQAARAAEREAIEQQIADLEQLIQELSGNIEGRVNNGIERAVGPMRKQIAQLEKQRDDARTSLTKAREKLAEKRPKAKAAPAVDGTTSFRAMCILQAVEALHRELKITPKECVAIQFEVSERLTGEAPAIKLAPAATQARAIMTWCQEFLAEMEARKGAGNA